jgi:hypothetical protein
MTDRESVDLYFGAVSPSKPADGPGNFRVYVVYRDGVQRFLGCYGSLLAAIEERDREIEKHRAEGYDHTRVHIAVFDEDDPERGDLDWDDAEGEP